MSERLQGIFFGESMTAGRSVNTKSVHWGTPLNYIAIIHKFFGTIKLDPCSNEFSKVGAEVSYELPMDGLQETWEYSTIFVNPPYGRDSIRKTSIKNWLSKCYEASLNGSEIIALVPVATNTTHWKEFVFGKADVVCFLKDSRVKFLEDGESKGKGAPMSCCLIYYGNRIQHFKALFNELGTCVNIKD